MAFIELGAKGQNSITLKSKDLATCGFQERLQAHPPKPTETAQFQKGQPTPCKTTYAFRAHLWVREFWPQIYSLLAVPVILYKCLNPLQQTLISHLTAHQKTSVVPSGLQPWFNRSLSFQWWTVCHRMLHYPQRVSRSLLILCQYRPVLVVLVSRLISRTSGGYLHHWPHGFSCSEVGVASCSQFKLLNA